MSEKAFVERRASSPVHLGPLPQIQKQLHPQAFSSVPFLRRDAGSISTKGRADFSTNGKGTSSLVSLKSLKMCPRFSA